MISMNRNTADGVRLLVLGLLLAMAMPVFAVPQLMTSYGDQLPWYGADINAMGGTGIALYRGGMSNILNPAFLGVETGTRLDVGVALDQHHEDRFQPLFDTFDSYVTDAAIASNRTHSWQAGLAAAHRLGDVNSVQDLTVGFSLADRRPFGYEFREDLRNPSPFDAPRDALMETRSREVTGTLRALSAGLSTVVVERVTMGAAVHYNFGTRTDVRSVRDYQVADGDSSYYESDEHELSGVNVTLGLRAVITERVELGVAWESAYEASGDFTHERVGMGSSEPVTVDGHYRFPSQFSGGLTFRPRSDPETVFTIEMSYINWSELEDSRFASSDLHLQDVTDVRIGVEHLFYNGIPVRFGFRHYDSYEDRDVGASAFSAGVGVPVGDGLLQGSVELNKITAIMDHQFPYPPGYFSGQFAADPQARVEDTRFRMSVGYTLKY